MLCDENSEVFQRIGEIVSSSNAYEQLTGDNVAYHKFIERYPADSLSHLTLEQYCLGKGSVDSNFSWWIERGLEKALGRYSPGTSKGHIIYLTKDGSTYIAKRLKHLGEKDALQYILKMHAAIAETNSSDINWIDDNEKFYQRAGVDSLQPISSGRKLRILSVYHPDVILPIQSVRHLRHFLTSLGVPQQSLPHHKKPIAHMLMLRECYDAIKDRFNQKLTPYGFMHALYSDELGIRPDHSWVESEDEDEDDYDYEYMTVTDPDFESPLNQILYGPPGTGKTFNTAAIAVKTAEPQWYREQYETLISWDEFYTVVKARYNELISQGRIVFTTFHQSFSYEDFIEGIRADTVHDESTGSSVLKYEVKSGVFKELADRANRAVSSTKMSLLSDTPRIWKISIYERSEVNKRNTCLDKGEARIGWRKAGDISNPLELRSEEEQAYWNELSLTNRNTLEAFANEISVGDVLLCLKDAESIQAVGIVTSPYQYNAEAAKAGDFPNILGVKWLLRDIDFNIVKLNNNTRLTLKTVYPLDRISWDDLVVALKQQGYELPQTYIDKNEESSQKPPYVLIIDEINRGNISRIFGELITLLEDDKRKGRADERTVVLPYSKLPFQVPPNLHVIGTMNTADKSLAQLDIALRRRFNFVELPPNPDLLQGVKVHGVDMGEMLDVMNQRIEVLLDRDHLLGHAYLLPLKDISSEDAREVRLAEIFENNIIPLLQEYFFDDWERIQWVLNDLRKGSESAKFIINGGRSDLQQLFGSDIHEGLSERRFRLNREALSNPLAYKGILNGSAS